MKNYLYLKRFSVAILIAMNLNVDVECQTLLNEDFNYPAGSSLTANGWNAHSSAGTNPVKVNSLGLSYTGYPSSNIGLSAILNNTGEDVNRTFTALTTGKVFCSFLVVANTVSSDYFLHLMGTPNGNKARVFLSGSGNTINFGLSKFNEAPVYSSGTSYITGTTYLLVLKYSIIAGTDNDSVSLFVLTGTIPSAEPSIPTIGPLANAGESDFTGISAVALRQFSTNQNILIDGIRISQRWEDAVGALTGNVDVRGQTKRVVYPVPVTDELTISDPDNIKNVEIFDISGRKVVSFKKEVAGNIRIPVNHLSGGLYILKLNTSQGTEVKRFVKR
jgi:hypothetical protein